MSPLCYCLRCKNPSDQLQFSNFHFQKNLTMSRNDKESKYNPLGFQFRLYGVMICCLQNGKHKNNWSMNTEDTLVTPSIWQKVEPGSLTLSFMLYQVGIYAHLPPQYFRRTSKTRQRGISGCCPTYPHIFDCEALRCLVLLTFFSIIQ